MIFENLAKNHEGEPGYEVVRVKDKNPLGKTEKIRILKNPNDVLRQIHGKFKDYLYSLNLKLPHATAFKKGASPLKNIEPHRKNRYFYVLDIHKAYQQVNGVRLAEMLCQLDKNLQDQEKEVFEFLKKYCLTTRESLIAGYPSSPILFNIYAGVLIDEPLNAFCKKHNLTYTRYCDDLTFSSVSPIGKRKRKAIRDILLKVGFPISHRKSKVCDLSKGAIVITGIGLELGGRTFLPRHYLRKLTGIVHNALYKKEFPLIKIEGMMGTFWSPLNGYFSFIKNKKERKRLAVSYFNKTEKRFWEKYQSLRIFSKNR